MLEIRNDVDLKELEKYKVERFGKFNQFIGRYSRCSSMGIAIGINDCDVGLVTMDSHEDMDEYDDELLDWFYDLVKDGIIKKG